MNKRPIISSFMLVALAGCQSTGTEQAPIEKNNYIPPIHTPNGLVTKEKRLKLLEEFSDDFEQATLDESKWENAPKSLNVGAWTFAQPNAYVNDGQLVIEATQETHTRPFKDSCWDGKAGGSAKTVERTLYYKSGAVRSAKETVYGYYEAKMQGVKIFPGLCPSFWMYSDGHPFPDRNDKSKQYVDYSEIDIVELQQADWRAPGDEDDVYDMDLNLHARVEENGRIVWKRPKPNKATQFNHYRAPFDPSKGFHTYAVENRKDKITWYVDGVKVAEKPNTWWHRPMHVIFSMGLRRKFIKYNPACQRADPNPDYVVKEGYPEDARMRVDYVRGWEVLPSIWLDHSSKQLKSIKYTTSDTLSVKLHYHGGSNYHVASPITVSLVERTDDKIIQTIQTQQEPSVTSEDKRYGGELEVKLNLQAAKPLSRLANGHYYALQASFKSSNGETISLLGEPVRINVSK
ncbi:Kappa-carrageenase [Catenovulum agarivorans DS-2]|uniref:Kappa-carrageenase n=1 Tax=Catenovulum agarivorans DS-2 TaxID=1328313 RepID=W7QP45_9ALTE|nr:family 16 glycosylhydrolase [Catenovulum agarivorans]EWH10747.1 Kappa-carrageenase [Catenovulum agarivorans DS-2]